MRPAEMGFDLLAGFLMKSILEICLAASVEVIPLAYRDGAMRHIF